MKYRVEGVVPAPDGNGKMTRVVIAVGDSEIVWLTRDTASIASRLDAFEQRLIDQSATRAGVLDEKENDRETDGKDGWDYGTGDVLPQETLA